MGEKRTEPGTVMGCHPEKVLAHSRMSANILGLSGTQFIYLLLSSTQGRPSWNLALWADAKARWAISPHHIHHFRTIDLLSCHPIPCHWMAGFDRKNSELGIKQECSGPFSIIDSLSRIGRIPYPWGFSYLSGQLYNPNFCHFNKRPVIINV